MTNRATIPQRSFLRDRSGSAAIEMAVSLPVCTLMLFGIFQFAIVLFGYCSITYGSRLAARYASLNSSTSLSPCTTASVKAVVAPFLWAAPSGGASIQVSWNPSNTIGSTVTVTTKIVYSTGIPYSTLKSVSVQSVATRTVMR